MLLFAAATLGCLELPKVTTSLQCAVQAVNERMGYFKPYQGIIETDCEESFKESRGTLMTIVQENLICNGFEYETIDCMLDYFMRRRLDVIIVLLDIADQRYEKNLLYSDWFETFGMLYEELKEASRGITGTCGAMPKDLHRMLNVTFATPQ